MLLLTALAIVLGINALLFGVAFRRQSDKLTDFAYSLSFIVVAIAAVALSAHRTPALVLMAAMVLAWALRLGGFLVLRIRKIGKDARFDGIRENFWRFLKFWLGQGVVAWLLLLPLLFVARRQAQIDVFAMAGICIWAISLCTEAIADAQKYAFNQKPANKGKWIDEGLWRYSRHPNYLGEIGVWVGMYVTAFSSMTALEQCIGAVSPLAIFITLRFVSGVPPLERVADKRWGADKAYQAYKHRTGLLLPMRKS